MYSCQWSESDSSRFHHLQDWIGSKNQSLRSKVTEMSEPSNSDAHGASDVAGMATHRNTSLRVYAWLNQPLATSWCLIGWVTATIVFVTVVHVFGGPTQDDVSVSAYSTWAVAHGHLACAYSPLSSQYFPPIASPYTMIAPLYPLISGAVLAITRGWGSAPFPTSAELGQGCSHALVAMMHWSFSTNVIGPTIEVGYLMWIPVLFGAILLMRATGRGRTRWEPMSLIGLAVLPPVLECLVIYFHPQDLLAIGLVMSSLGFFVQRRWIWAGAMIGFACTAHPFALLAAAVLLVVIPNKERIRFAVSGVAAVALIVVPLAVVTSGRALKWSVLGSGYAPPPSGAAGGTVMREIGLNPHVLLASARILPIACAFLLALWARRKLGDSVLSPVPLLSLVATAVATRLVFEVSLWGYYFAASVTLIIINDVVQGRVRGHVVALIALFTLVFNPVPWGFATNGSSWGLTAREAMPNVFVIGALILILIDVWRRHVRWYVVAWLGLVCLTLIKDPFSHAALRTSLPNWFWQVLMIPILLFLAASPLIKAAYPTTNEFVDPTMPSDTAMYSGL